MDSLPVEDQDPNVSDSPMTFLDYHDTFDTFEYLANGSEMNSIDLDLYGQPFALDLLHFRVLILHRHHLCHPLLRLRLHRPSRPPGVPRPFEDEPELQPSIGTTHLQPLHVSRCLLLLERLYSFVGRPHRSFAKTLQPFLELGSCC